jgi:hypothetical protein
MRRLGLALPIFLLATQLQGQTGPTKMGVSALSRIYAQDQQDRGVALADDGETMLSKEEAKTFRSLDDDEVVKRDAERRKQVLAMFHRNEIVTGRDFRYASFVFQHGQTADDYLLAHVLAVEAVLHGNTVSKLLAVATLDRYLQAIGQKQVFGTQFLNTQYAYYLEHRRDADVIPRMQAIVSEETQEPYNELLLPDFVREDFCVPDLKEQQNYIALRRSGKPASLPKISNCAH